jgi:hypothetical protein
MILGIDSASAIWDLSQAKREGYSFTMRYGPPNRYQMSQAECDAIRSQDFGVGLIFEVEGDRSLRGGAQGALDGKRHNDWADACGAPSWLRLPYCVQDTAMTQAQLRGPVADYARAFTENCARPTMPYGSYDCLEIICGERMINPYGWQTPGWSGNGTGSGGSFTCSDGTVRRLSRFAAMIQDVNYVLGGTADRNVVFKPVDWAWGGPYTGPINPTEPIEDDEVPKIYMLTSSAKNRKWLTTKNNEGISPGMLAGLTNANGEPIDAEGNPLPNGWDAEWAGLCVWEQKDSTTTQRKLMGENVDFYNAVKWSQAISGEPITIFDLGFQDDIMFTGRTAIHHVVS